MKPLKLTFIILISIACTQCNQETEFLDSQFTLVTDEITLSKITKLGFDTQTYPVWQDGEFFTVEEDINIPASYLDALSEGPQSEQRHWVNIVSCNEIRYITVYNNIPSGTARNAVSLAMRNWNNITKCDLFFASTSNINSAEVIISNGSLPNNVVGQANFPSNGRPGRYIRLDLNQHSNFDYAQWRSTIEHELGHSVGFAHTNGTSTNEIYIPGTLFTDDNSLMNGGRGGTVRKLTGDDKKAARLLYNLNFADRICN